MTPRGAAGIRLAPRRLLGRDVAVELRPGPGVDRDHVEALLVGLPAAPGPADTCVVRAGPGTDLPTVGALLRHLDDLAADSVRDTHAVVHAAAAQLAGVTVVVPGPSGSGKSTMAAALVAAGWDHLSDELVPLDIETGEALPYPTGVRLRSPAWALMDLTPPAGARLRWPFPLDALRPGAIAGGPASPTAIVLLDRSHRSGVSHVPSAALIEVPRARGLDALARSTANLSLGGAPVWEALRRTVERSTTLELQASRPDDAADALDRWARQHVVETAARR